jgi:hypothetical protein
MPRPAEPLAPNARVIRNGYLVVALLAAVGLLLTTTIGLTTGVTLSWRAASWWHTANYLAATVSWPQWLGLITWAIVTGALISAGIRRRSIGLLLALAALLAGALVPVGLVVLAGALNHVWPGTTGPTDAPVLTFLLLAYALVIPWTLGRAITAFRGSRC